MLGHYIHVLCVDAGLYILGCYYSKQWLHLITAYSFFLLNRLGILRKYTPVASYYAHQFYLFRLLATFSGWPYFGIDLILLIALFLMWQGYILL